MRHTTAGLLALVTVLLAGNDAAASGFAGGDVGSSTRHYEDTTSLELLAIEVDGVATTEGRDPAICETVLSATSDSSGAVQLKYFRCDQELMWEERYARR